MFLRYFFYIYIIFLLFPDPAYGSDTLGVKLTIGFYLPFKEQG